MNTSDESKSLIENLSRIANHMRILSIRATTAAGSGHPTSCCSAADLVAALFFGKMRFDPDDPRRSDNDRFILSKGHAAPLLYAAWAETGHVPEAALETLRELDSDFEGHPTPRLDFVDVATGSLGQGLSAGLGMALKARLDHLDFNVYVLMGDGETAEGSVWEAASLAGVRKMGNLVAIVDVNRLGQSHATALGWDVEVYRQRFEAFGWRATVIDGHDFGQILGALDEAGRDDQPFAIIAKTIKGKGIPAVENKPGWHGKPLSPEQAREAYRALGPVSASALSLGVGVRRPSGPAPRTARTRALAPLAEPQYKPGEKVATRKAFANALVRVGAARPDVVVFDGDVANSTYTELFEKKYPERFFECYIAEQNMVGAAVGMGSLGKTPFCATFAAFFSRAMDQLRMAAISMANVKLVGTHSGVSIGEDGPSQMGLEDIAEMRTIHGSAVLHPCDAYSTERLVEQIADHPGVAYLRTARPATPILYEASDRFVIGGARVLRDPPSSRVTIVAAGVTVFEALKASDELEKSGVPVSVIDAYSIKPLARDQILAVARKTANTIITVEDHYAEGGLGDAVAGELSAEGMRVHKLAVRELPHSGKEMELLAKYGIDAASIVRKVRELAGQSGESRAA